MLKLIPENLLRLAEDAPFPLYVVGGSVRDFLAGYAERAEEFTDWDICAPVSAETFVSAAEKCNFAVRSVYKNTGTVKLRDEKGIGYEFSSFRSDEYVRGEHRPAKIFFTQDMEADARRRDFTCNAVYYCIREGKFYDPLCGERDIREKKMRTVREARRVFGEDGLRLMRLARQCAQLGFQIEEDTLNGARANAELICDIAPERILTELELLLHADEKYGVADGHYRGLCVLRETGVLGRIFPELAMGDGMAQRADFHRYDVLEHSFRCVLYAKPNVRLAALLHDVGKPFCRARDGNVYEHNVEGAEIAVRILNRLKAPKRQTEHIRQLVLWHMYDMDCKTRESKVRRFLAEHAPLLPDLFDLMQADFSACMDDLSVSPPRAHLEGILRKMEQERAPMSVNELKINGKALIEQGVEPQFIGAVLRELWLSCAVEPRLNNEKHLLKAAQGVYRSLSAQNT